MLRVKNSYVPRALTAQCMTKSFTNNRFAVQNLKYSTAPDERFEVNVEDADSIDTKNFFKYSWGRWLVNDEKERAMRETKFSIKGLVDLLTEKVNYLENKPENAQLSIKTIEPYHEGKHHKIYRVQLGDGRQYALRIPYAIGHEEYRKARMQSEVATMDFLKRKHEVIMPSVIAWSPTKDNRLGSEYMLLDFVSGDLLMKQWQPSSTDIQAKSATIKPAVDLMSTIVDTAFNKYGALYFIEDVASQYQNDLPYEGETNRELVDRYRIGPTTESRFWKGPTSQFAEKFRGPWTSMQDYLNATADVQIAYTENLMSGSSANKEDLQKTLDTFKRYKELTPILFDPKGEQLNSDIIASRLHHPDLNPINIIHRSDKTYLLDVENTALRPFILHGAPQFVKHRGPKIFKKEDIPEYETMSEQEKQAVDFYICQTQNQFAFEYLFKSAKPELFGAFSPSVKRRQEIVHSELHVSAGTKEYLDLDYDILRLAQEWAYLGVERQFPLSYSETELQQYVDNMDAWNQHVMENPFIETKGWVPQHMFEQLLGQGIIERQDNGDFKFVKPFQM